MLLRHLNKRNKVKNLLDFTNRHVGIGVNTLVIFKNYTGKIHIDGNYKNFHKCLLFLLHKRSSSNVTEAMGTYHVMPAGTFRPIGSTYRDDKEELSLKNTVHREFLEELFNNEELETDSVVEMLRGYEFPQTYYLGFGLDALSTKCEIMTCMVIDLEDKRYRNLHPRYYDYNYEGDGTLKLLTETNLKHYMDSEKTLPVTRDILKIVLTQHKLLGIEHLPK